MNENIRKILKALNDYIQDNLTLTELDDIVVELYVDSDVEFTESQSDILCDINDDIGFTARNPYTEEDKAINLFTENQLKEKITKYMMDLAPKG